MNKIFTQLIRQRGITDEFLRPHYDRLTSPDQLPDMTKAVERIKAALSKGERIIIYGDYDVDGVTASALMGQTLRLCGQKPELIDIMLPNRFRDGYGMSGQLVQRAKATGAGLVVTVDCGSANHQIIEELRSLGIDTIVTDHHECPTNLPPALALINPKRQDFTGPSTLKNLAGVGVAFMLARGLALAGLIATGQEKWLLDLVLLGTICDGMVLTGENRALCYYGLQVLGKTRRPGLQELMRTAGVHALTSDSIGFQLGPRLNAAGRLESAESSLELLQTPNRTRAAALAEKLEALNRQRREEQQSALSEILARGVSSDPVIVETGAWHEGVLGIIAGQLVERYHRPAFVLAPSEDGSLKGSGRSFGDFNLAAALEAVAGTTIGGGGHAAAAGVKLLTDRLAEFRAGIKQYYCSLHLPPQEKYFQIQADLDVTDLSDISLELIDALKQLEPFGAGNEEPIFCVKHPRILYLKPMGDHGQHLRIDIADSGGRSLKLVAFNTPTDWRYLDTDAEYDFFLRPIENNWNGVRSVEARLLDLRPSE